MIESLGNEHGGGVLFPLDSNQSIHRTVYKNTSNTNTLFTRAWLHHNDLEYIHFNGIPEKNHWKNSALYSSCNGVIDHKKVSMESSS